MCSPQLRELIGMTTIPCTPTYWRKIENNGFFPLTTKMNTTYLNQDFDPWIK